MGHKAVSVGVIGWGNFFKHIHEQTLRDLVAQGVCRLRAVCVRSPEARSAIAGSNSPDYTTPDCRQLLSDPQIDAVIIGAPHGVQAELSLASLTAGKWVYVEKPLFADEAETARPLIAWYEQFQKLGDVALQRLAVGLNKRFAPAYRDLRQRARQWGGLRNIHMSIVDDAWRWGAKYPPGFLMWLDACHWIDLARWLTGAEIAQISCLTPQVEDSLVTLRMSNGAVVSILLSGNGTMDMLKEELRATSGGRTCASVTDYVQLEIFGGSRREVHSYPANLQTGGDPRYVSAITDGGLESFRGIRREMYDRFLRVQIAPDAAEEAYLRNNLPNFMRPQGWRESLGVFIRSVAAGTLPEYSATWRDAYIACQVVEAARASVAAGGTFVSAGE